MAFRIWPAASVISRDRSPRDRTHATEERGSNSFPGLFIGLPAMRFVLILCSHMHSRARRIQNQPFTHGLSRIGAIPAFADSLTLEIERPARLGAQMSISPINLNGVWIPSTKPPEKARTNQAPPKRDKMNLVLESVVISTAE
jgi:hypothetical protein